MDEDQVQGNRAKADQSVDKRLDAFFKPKEAEPKVAVEAKQPEPVPSSDQKPAEEAKKVEEKVEVPPQDDLSLPESASPRTKEQFEKLKSRLKEKEEALRAKEAETKTPQDYGTSAFDVLHAPEQITPQAQGQMPSLNNFPALNPLQMQNIQNQFVDKDGNVDINGLNAALRNANERATLASEDARRTREQLAKFEETQQVREAHSKFPEIDPKNKDFNPQFFEAVRDRLVRNMWENKKQSLAEAAEAVRQMFTPQNVNKVDIEKQAVDRYKETQQARNQGPFESGKGERQPDMTYDEVRRRTRKETFKSIDSPALNKRLQDYFSKK